MKRKRDQRKPPLTIGDRRAKELLSRRDLQLFGINYSRTTLWKWIKHGMFPAPVSITPKAQVWAREEIEQWVDDRLRARRRAA
jgi:predicted DNA-binding transcriptional regulator AlpA